MAPLLRLRSEIHREVGEERKALADLVMIADKSAEDQCRVQEAAERLGLSLHEVQEERKERGEGGGQAGVGEKHKHLKLFSSKVNIRKEEGRGRFVESQQACSHQLTLCLCRFLLAGEDIRPGELIASETSHTGVLDRQFVGSNCSECLLPVVTVYPCPACSTARFCSPRCLSRAQAGSHRSECLLQDCLYRSGSGAWLLAYRILAGRNLQQWRDLAPRLARHDESLGLREEEEYDSSDVATAYNLVTHDTGAAREAPHLMKESLTAIFFLRCLQAKSYFGPGGAKRNGVLTEDQLFICKLLHHFMRVVYYNSHEESIQQRG